MASAAATAMAAVPPSRAEILSLLRSFLRTASKFNDYNVREYVKRRSLDAFRENKSLSDPSSLASTFSEGKAQLEVAKRQALVYSLCSQGQEYHGNQSSEDLDENNRLLSFLLENLKIGE